MQKTRYLPVLFAILYSSSKAQIMMTVRESYTVENLNKEDFVTGNFSFLFKSINKPNLDFFFFFLNNCGLKDVYKCFTGIKIMIIKINILMHHFNNIESLNKILRQLTLDLPTILHRSSSRLYDY